VSILKIPDLSAPIRFDPAPGNPDLPSNPEGFKLAFGHHAPDRPGTHVQNIGRLFVFQVFTHSQASRRDRNLDFLELVNHLGRLNLVVEFSTTPLFLFASDTTSDRISGKR